MSDALKKFAVALILFIPSVLLSGLVTRLYWNWFAILALGLHPIGFAQAVALNCLVDWFRDGVAEVDKKPVDEYATYVIGKYFIRPLVALGLGAGVRAAIS